MICVCVCSICMCVYELCMMIMCAPWCDDCVCARTMRAYSLCLCILSVRLLCMVHDLCCLYEVRIGVCFDYDMYDCVCLRVYGFCFCFVEACMCVYGCSMCVCLVI